MYLIMWVILALITCYCVLGKTESIAKISDIGRKILAGKIVVKNEKAFELYIKTERYVMLIVVGLFGVQLTVWCISYTAELQVAWLPVVLLMGKRVVDYCILLPKIEKGNE